MPGDIEKNMGLRTDALESTFSDIYRHQRWGKGAGSGEGSNPLKNKDYIRVLQEFIRNRGVKSVVDLGCGDWQFSRHVDWSGVNYIGIDVVPTLIQELTVAYATENISFIQGNLVTCELPQAELVICKDVLQHLSTTTVLTFLKRLSLFNYAILTNDREQYRHPGWRNLWNLWHVELTRPNSEIREGGYRPLRLRESPFNLEAQELLRTEMWHHNGMHLKEVLVWENRST